MTTKIKLVILLTYFICISNTSLSESQVCDIKETVDITKGNHLPNGVVYFEGIQYERTDYFVDDSGVKRGCICLKKQCISKCCSFGQGYHMKMKKCVNVTDNFEPPVWDRFRLRPEVKATKRFHFLFGKKECNSTESRLIVGKAINDYHLRMDGQLYLEVPHHIPPWMTRSPDKYCIDTFVSEDEQGNRISRLDALICFSDEQTDKSQYLLSSTCMIISCVFILATLAVYAWLPELRNMHGMVLMVYLSCFFFGFVFLATMQILIIVDNITVEMCLVLTILIYFSLVSAFFWLNVMSFDIWWTFSGKRGHSARLKSTKARFLAYCGYAFGMSSALTILLVSLEFSGLASNSWMPLLRLSGCFIYGTSKLIYLYGPILILCVANLVFFILTAVKIAQIRKQTSVLKSKDNSTHDPHRNDKQRNLLHYKYVIPRERTNRLVLYVKLFLVMGINWVLEVVSALYPDIPMWKFTDAYNVLIGLTIFIIFVCKRKIFRLIKKSFKNKNDVNVNSSSRRPTDRPVLELKYKQLRGEPMSRTQTTTSSRTTSTRMEELQMNSVKK